MVKRLIVALAASATALGVLAVVAQADESDDAMRINNNVMAFTGPDTGPA
jgi:hypothetical protein